MLESFWARLQVELLNRHRWKTRIELASPVPDYIELFHNTRRRHSALGMRMRSEVEAASLARSNDVVVEASPARTAPTGVVDEIAKAGLSYIRDGSIHEDHHHDLTNNDKAA